MGTEQAKKDIDVAIILLTLNQGDKTIRCLTSLQAVTGPDFRIMLWDNGSSDNTIADVRANFPDVLTHHHPENAGVAAGRNMAVNFLRQRYAPRYLLFLDNDMTVEADFLEHLMAPFAADEKIAQTTAKILDMGNPRRLYGAGGCRVRFWLGDTTHNGYGEMDRGQYDSVRQCLPSGGCMLVRAAVFDELAGFTTVYDPYGPEDLDFGMRVTKAEYYGLFVPEAVVYHESRPGRTFEGGAYTSQFAANRVRNWFTFMRRHASPGQKLGFYLIGIPVLLAGFVRRQARRGVLLSSLKSLAAGIYNYLRGVGK